MYIDLKGLPSIPNYLDDLKNVFVELQNSPHFEIVRTWAPNRSTGTRPSASSPSIRGPRSRLWADAKTGLPVRIEQKEGQLLTIVQEPSVRRADGGLRCSAWRCPRATREQKMELDLFGSTEADFIEGLRILAEKFGDGRFPDGVSLEDYLKQVAAIEKKFEGAQPVAPTSRPRSARSSQKYVLFMRFFKGEGKWYYRGKGVQLGAAETPIFWYRPKDSATYRVIYGDLHVEDVAPDKLPEPLDADDVAESPLAYQQWSKPEFVGTQEDYWMILPEGKTQVKAYVTLLKGPTDVSSMPITLPYPNAPLEAVLLDREPLTFQKTGEGTYNVELPLDKLAAGQAKLIFQWHVSLSDLPSEGDVIKTVLKSLIPVTSYALKVGVDPQSGFEPTQEPEGMWVTPFTCGAPEKPITTFGSCGLMIRPRK